MKRIYSIDVFKLLFAYFIALAHFGMDVAPGSGVTVQLFYIISGFFLARKFYSKKNALQAGEYNQWDYTKDHIKTLYPHYAFSLIVFAGYLLSLKLIPFLKQPNASQLLAMAKDIYSLIPEFLLLQNTGFFGGGINYPLWQVCALVISSYFVYGLLCANEKLSRELIFPAAILMIQAFFATSSDIWGTTGFFHIPLLRAFSPLCMGVLAYYLTTTPYYQRITSHNVLFNCASVYALVTLFLFKNHRNIFLITFVVLLLAMYDANSWINKLLNHKLFRHFGTFSYAIYLNHAIVIQVLNQHVFHRISGLLGFPLSDKHRALIYLGVLTLYSVFTLWFVNKLKRAFATRKPVSAQKL